jgi:ketosteroid isomerase-like protein
MSGSTSKHAVVNRYFELVPTQDVQAVVALFADKAEVFPVPLPQGGPVRGRDALVSLYEGMLSQPAQFRQLCMYDDGPVCVTEIQAEAGPGRPAAEVVDIFTIDAEDRISRLSVYKR